MNDALRFVHLVAVAVWIGGMVFAHLCLRPAAAETLGPPQRLALMAGALGRFFRYVTIAIVLLWVTGLARLAQVGVAQAPVGWLAMAAIAAAMTAIFAVIAHRHFPAMRAATAEQRYPDAAAALATIRSLVAVNLGLGVATIAAATLLR